MRIALYWAPEHSTPLGRVAADWLKQGECPVNGVPNKEVRRLLSAPKHYGFHATLKPPFQLRAGCVLEEIEQELALFVAEEQNKPFLLPGLEVAQIGSFFCLRPIADSGVLNDFSAATVKRFDHFRKPAGEDEIARRRAAGLTARQDQLLLKWGYPYVFDEFRFHLTLTGSVQDSNHFQPLKQELVTRFAPALHIPCSFDSLSMFIQHGSQPFSEYRRWSLGKM